MRVNQIFFDEKSKRWKYSKRTMLIVVAFLIASFAVTTVSIFMQKPLPKIAMDKKDESMRKAQSINAEKKQETVSYTQNFQKPKQKTDRTAKVMAYYVNWDANSFTSLKEHIHDIDILMPEWLYLKNSAGDIAMVDEKRQKETLDYVRNVRSDLPIHVLINNYNEELQQWDSAVLLQMLSDQTSRANTIDQLITFAKENKLQGVSIDFGDVETNQEKNIEAFMREFSEKAKPAGLQVSQTVPLESSYNLSSLSQYSDYMVFMAYDESSVNFTQAGPLASQGWFQQQTQHVFAQVPSEKVVISIGGYGYDWIEDAKEGSVLTFQETMTKAAQAQSEIQFDAASLNPHFDYYKEDKLHHVWLLDAVTAYNQMNFADTYTPFGYVFWRMGSEDPSVWKAFEARENKSKDIHSELQKVPPISEVFYDGEGEILQTIQEPANGQRSIEIDEKSGMIVAERYEKISSAYMVTRWGGGNKKKIALTFDDGPDKGYTTKVLDILKEKKTPATFFVIGMNANLNPNVLQRMEKEGHEVGNHTYTHPNIATISKDQLSFELDASQRLFEGLLKKKSVLFRPPYSQDLHPNDPAELKPLLTTNSLGYYTVGMNIDPRDWENPGKDEIVRRVIMQAKEGEGNVVVLHDGGGDRSQTVAALPEIIEGLQTEGFEIVPISELLNVPHDAIMPPVKGFDYYLTRSNSISFHVVSYLLQFTRFVFFAGILLSSFRFVFLAVLALAQATHSRRAFYRRSKKLFEPKIAVVIPAYNEEKVIVATVQSILQSSYRNLEIIVVNDGSTDTTNYRLKDAFDQHEQVSILRQENKGKAAALNYGISLTYAEIIITLDADTIFLPDTIRTLIRGFQDSRVAAIAGNAKVGNRLNILTRWQALEYIVSQNLDRRAFEFINCISVVPGSIGAWRRSAIIEAGGFSSDTLAEDADLTLSVLRNGHLVSYEEEAIAYTEAPESVRSFLKQRFRWMYGTLQTAWKHKKTIVKHENIALGYFTLPNIFIFQILFPLISPLMDLMLILSVIWIGWQNLYHQIEYSAPPNFTNVVVFYFFFLLIDLVSAAVPFSLERKEQWKLLLWLPLQRFFYRQLMYYVAIKTTLTAMKGSVVGWGKFERKASVVKS